MLQTKTAHTDRRGHVIKAKATQVVRFFPFFVCLQRIYAWHHPMSSLGEAHPDFARKVDAKAIYRKFTSSEQCFGFEHAPQESWLRKALDSPWLIVVVWFVADRLAVHWLRIATLIPWLILIGQRHLVCGRTWCAIGKPRLRLH